MFPHRHPDRPLLSTLLLSTLWFVIKPAVNWMQTHLSLIHDPQPDRHGQGYPSQRALASLLLLPLVVQTAQSPGTSGRACTPNPNTQASTAQSRDGYLGTDRGFDLYIDPNSIVATLPIVRFRLRAVSTPAAGRPRSTQFEMSLDCGARILRVLRATGFDGSGRVVANRDYTFDDPARSLTSFGAIGNRIYQTVCAGRSGNLY